MIACGIWRGMGPASGKWLRPTAGAYFAGRRGADYGHGPEARATGRPAAAVAAAETRSASGRRQGASGLLDFHVDGVDEAGGWC